MTIIQAPVERRVVLEEVSWSLYEQMLQEVGDGHVRLTYDHGRLEIMSPSPHHEHVKKIIARLIEAYADAMNMRIEGLGSTTFRREDLKRGLEPDECYYITNPSAMLGKEQFDLTIDPPPDLAVEVDISRPEVAKQPIYAALNVPEIWRYDGRAVVSFHRTENAGSVRYVQGPRSLAFPGLPMEIFNQFLTTALNSGQTDAVRALREWVRSA